MSEVNSSPDTSKTSKSKGGRKGGTIFPRIGLDVALTYSKKLVSKTAISAQPEATILAGVFNNAGSDGKIRLSALKQFGLAEGTAAAYKSTQLGKDIEAAGDDAERIKFVRLAFLKSKTFLELYNTYQDDSTTKAKLKGRAQQLGVHPDASELCADLFIISATAASMANTDGEGIRLAPLSGVSVISLEEQQTEIENSGDDDESIGSTPEESTRERHVDEGSAKPRPRTAADVTLNLNIDSSWDGEKLEKHLGLLRKFGLI